MAVQNIEPLGKVGIWYPPSWACGADGIGDAAGGQAIEVTAGEELVFESA
ncbi:hypothetical protein HZA57_01975 [Candidatus Poribacteria bacterium]|nr:hypothetical protein [Candidatus Poribacteria bacterium]